MVLKGILRTKGFSRKGQMVYWLSHSTLYHRLENIPVSRLYLLTLEKITKQVEMVDKNVIFPMLQVWSPVPVLPKNKNKKPPFFIEQIQVCVYFHNLGWIFKFSRISKRELNLQLKDQTRFKSQLLSLSSWVTFKQVIYLCT